tara:strand:+ start:474 stop:1181 length:708 start_codon:yes stop_codon:yes gene_type:complete
MSTSSAADEMNTIFAIGCNTYGLNPVQLWHIQNSLSKMKEMVYSYNKEQKEDYVNTYNILAKLLNNVQQVGNVFKLEDAGNVFKSLHTLKEFIEKEEVTEELDTSFRMIQNVVQACFFSKLIYTQEQLEKIKDNIDVLRNISNDEYKHHNQLENLNYLRDMIEIAQNKGRYSLDQANAILTVLTNVKKQIIEIGVERQKKLNDEYKEPPKFTSDLGENEVVSPAKTSKKGKKNKK